MTSACDILYDRNRNPPQPDSRAVVIKNNVMRSDPLVGCELTGVACWGNG
jgi:hypothetical protein